MLNTELHLNPSPYSGLYDILVPAGHILRRIDALVDFSFVMDKVRDKYSDSIGRLGKSPVMLFKYLLLKSMHKDGISDLVAQSKIDEKHLGRLVDKTLDNGVAVENVMGDGAYSGRDNIGYSQGKGL